MSESYADRTAAEVCRIRNICRVIIGIRSADLSCYCVLQTRIALLFNGSGILKQDILLDCNLRWRNAVQLVVFHLFAATAVCFVYGALH